MDSNAETDGMKRGGGRNVRSGVDHGYKWGADLRGADNYDTLMTIYKVSLKYIDPPATASNDLTAIHFSVSIISRRQ